MKWKLLHTKEPAFYKEMIDCQSSSRGGNNIKLFDRKLIDNVILFSISWF